MRELNSGVSIVAVGDLMLGDSPTSVGFGFMSRYSRKGLRVAADRLRPLLRGGDILFGNLEAVLSFKSVQSGALRTDQMRGLPGFADDLRLLGFDVLSVANNHADQHGGEAFADMVSNLEGAGIRCCGLPGTSPWSSRPVILTRGSVQVGFLGYSLLPKQYGDMPPTYVIGQPEEIVADVRQLSEQVDHVVVSLHWGVEFVSAPSESERDLGHRLLGAGATLVLGHHPHVPRPVEEHEGGVIAYSLGNFISDMQWLPELRRSMVAVCELRSGGARLREIRPCRIGADYLPEPVELDPELEETLTYRPSKAIPDEHYERIAARALDRQRRALYAYSARNFYRYDPKVLYSLSLATLRSKVGALGRRLLAR